MTTREIVISMSEEQARRISPVIRAMKAGDLASAKAAVVGLTVKELDLLVSFLDAEHMEGSNGV